MKKRKTWLWVLGWLFIFPLPLTILLLKTKKFGKVPKIAIIAVAWILYLIFILSGMSGNSDTTQREGSKSAVETSDNNIRELSFTDANEVIIKVGSTVQGSLKVRVRSVKDFVPEDIIFVSENPDVAEVAFSQALLSTNLYFDIIGVSEGETNIYATSKDGTIKSQSIHVIVPEPIKVESLEILGFKSNLVINETTSAEVAISPADAYDTTLSWTSSDETVAIVNADGIVTAVGNGTATITVKAASGVEESFDINVDGSKTLMNLKVGNQRVDGFNIGDEWSYDIQVNGEQVFNTLGIGIGDTISFYAQIIESDEKPDVGSASTTYTVTKEDIENGFEVSMDVYVTENGGKNSGQSAHFIVTYAFSVKK